MPLAAVLVAWVMLAVVFLVMRVRTPAAGASSRSARSRDARSLYGFGGQILAIAIVSLWRRPPGAAFLNAGDDVATIGRVGVIVLAVAAVVVGVSAMIALGRVWPVGARMPDDHELRQAGPYAIVRHPLYTSVFLLILATGVAWSTIEATLVAVWIYWIAAHVRTGREEKLLSSALGTGYAAYAERVPRYLPRVWPSSPHAVDREAAFVSIYFCIYLLYLFVYQEGELLHWLSLALLPLALLPRVGIYKSFSSVLESIGLSRGAVGRGWGGVAAAGAAVVAVQLASSASRAELAGILRAPYGWAFPFVALALLLCSAATTEEVFFRGLLQARLANRLRHESAGWLVAAVAFALYHVPYAWFATSDATTGRAADVLQIAVTDGLVPGLLIGVVYWRSGRNLLAAIALHAIVDLLPAIRVTAAMLPR